MPKPYNGGKPTFNEGITPIGLVCHAYHDKPQLKTKDQHGKIPDIDPETNIQIAEYKITLAWAKAREAELMDMYNQAMLTQEQGWPGSTAPGAFFQLEPFFRDGDNPAHNTQNKEYLRGRYYLNFKQRAKAARDQMTGNVVYSGAPGLLGPHGPEDKIMPGDLWPGCTARVSYIMFATEYMGRHFISTRLQNVQKFDEGDGTRIGGGARPTAESQFGALIERPAGGLGGFGGMGGFGSQPQQPQGGAFGGGGGNMFGNPQTQPQGGNLFGNAGQQAGGGFGGFGGRRSL